MESGTIAAQGFRLRVPYGTLLCVSDKPLHGEIKLPGAANAFYETAIAQHLKIGLAALDLLKESRDSLHSRKLRRSTSRPSAESGRLCDGGDPGSVCMAALSIRRITPHPVSLSINRERLLNGCDATACPIGVPHQPVRLLPLLKLGCQPCATLWARAQRPKRLPPACLRSVLSVQSRHQCPFPPVAFHECHCNGMRFEKSMLVH